MKRVFLVTWAFGGGNYGQTLQAFALCDILEKYGYKVFLTTKETEYALYEKVLGNNPFMTGVYKMEWDGVYGDRDYITNRLVVFDEFVRKNFNFAEKNTDMDILCFGSDQIWNPVYDSKLMEYVNDASLGELGMFSYATSTGEGNFNREHQVIFEGICENIAKLHYISVREKEGAELIHESFKKIGIKDREISVLVDPVFLLSSDEWIERCNAVRNKYKNEKYILCYFVGKMTEEQRELIRAIGKEKNLKTIVLELFNEKELSGEVFEFPNPLEFVELVSDAEYVIADSYHAALFSIIFNKQFCMFSRNDIEEWHYENDIRLSCIIETLEISNRFICDYGDYCEMEAIDYSNVNHNLEKKINASKIFLSESLKGCWKITNANKFMNKQYFQYEYPKEIKKGDRIVIYGAGNVGKNIWAQSVLYNYADVVGWVDANAEKYANLELDIRCPDVLFEEYDYYFIAIRDEILVKSAVKNLELIGIDKEKIKWCSIEEKNTN